MRCTLAVGPSVAAGRVGAQWCSYRRRSLKQSIYRFPPRRAAVFGAVRASSSSRRWAAAWLECDRTRRNAPGVLAALNTVFEAAQGEGAFLGFRAHTTEVDADGAPALFALPACRARPRATSRTRRTSRAGATASANRAASSSCNAARPGADGGRGHRAADRGRRRPRELLVMAPAMRRWAAARAAQRRHVPCVAVDDATLIEAPEAQDLVAVLDALVSPQHRLSLARDALQPAVRRGRRRSARALAAPVRRATGGRADELARRGRCAGTRAFVLAVAGGSATCRRTICSTASSPRANCASASPRVCPPRSGGAPGHGGCGAGQSLALDGGRYATPMPSCARCAGARSRCRRPIWAAPCAC